MSGESKELDNTIALIVSQALENGKAKEALEEAVADSVRSAVRDVFSYRGEARKALEERIGQVIVPAIEEHDFGDYAVKLDAALENILESSALNDTAKAIASFKGLVSGSGGERVTFDDLFAAYGKWVSNDFDCFGRGVTDGEYDYISIAVETENRKSPWSKSDYECMTAEFSLDDLDSDDEQASKFDRVVEFYRWNGDYPIPENGGWFVRDTWKPIFHSLASLSEFDVLVMRLARSGYVSGEIEDKHDCVAPEQEPEIGYV